MECEAIGKTGEIDNKGYNFRRRPRWMLSGLSTGGALVARVTPISKAHLAPPSLAISSFA